MVILTVKRKNFSMLSLPQPMGPSVFLTQAAAASSTFYTNCTLPSSTVNFASSANVRGTLDILWSSLFTLLICTWTAQHLNIPEQMPDCTNWQSGLKETLGRGLIRVKWMFVALLVPEFLVGKAFQDFIRAKKSCHQMKEFAETDNIQWTLTHAYYANMGGFILRVGISSESKSADNEFIKDLVDGARPSQPLNSQDTDQPSTASEQNATQRNVEQQLPSLEPIDKEESTQPQSTQLSEAGARATIPSPNTSLNMPQPLASNTYLNDIEYAYPDASQLYDLRRLGIIARLPQVSRKEIEDKSKGDAFIKGTAVLQVLWLVVQVIARGVKRLPISQIEIFVIAFAACIFLTYIFSWAKPQNVVVANLASKEATARESIKEVENSGGSNYGISWFRNLKNLNSKHGIDIFRPIPNDADFDRFPGSAMITLMDVGMVLAGTIFGAVHLIAWGFYFPTQVESILWKVSSIYLAAVLPCYYCIAFVFERLGWIEGAYQKSEFCAKFIVYLSLLSYVFARLCLTVLVFRCLFFLPPESFVGTWASEVPNLQ